MDTLAKRILDALTKYHKEFTRGRILKTMEEVEANTNPENIASALVTGALINNLGGCQLSQEGNNFYIVGADSVRKKLGSMDFVLSSTLTPEWTDGNGIRNTVQVKINYTYKNGVLSHSITGLVSATKCNVSKSIVIN